MTWSSIFMVADAVGSVAKFAGSVPTLVAVTDVLAARPVERPLIVIAMELEAPAKDNVKGVSSLMVVGSTGVLVVLVLVVPAGGT